MEVPACDVCGRSPLPSEGGVDVRDVTLSIDQEKLAGELCDDHLQPLRDAGGVLVPARPPRRRRTFDSSKVSDPSQIPRDE